MSQLTTTTPSGVTGYQFNCNKTVACTHTAVGSGGWHTILCVWSHLILFHCLGMEFHVLCTCTKQFVFWLTLFSLSTSLPLYFSLLSVSFPPFPHKWVPSLPDIAILVTSGVLDVGCAGEWGKMGECCVLQSSGSLCHFSMQCLVHLYLNTLLSKLPTKWYTFYILLIWIHWLVWP